MTGLGLGILCSRSGLYYAEFIAEGRLGWQVLGLEFRALGFENPAFYKCSLQGFCKGSTIQGLESLASILPLKGVRA